MASSANCRFLIAYNQRGLARTELGYQAAITDFSQALQFNPGVEEIYMNRGKARFQLGDVQGAQADYQKAAELEAAFFDGDG